MKTVAQYQRGQYMLIWKASGKEYALCF